MSSIAFQELEIEHLFRSLARGQPTQHNEQTKYVVASKLDQQHIRVVRTTKGIGSTCTYPHYSVYLYAYHDLHVSLFLKLYSFRTKEGTDIIRSQNSFAMFRLFFIQFGFHFDS